MSGVTGIELGPNFCVLVRGGRLGSHTTVSAGSTIMPSAWPDDPRALVEPLREARMRHDLSSRARVVAWSHGHAPGAATTPGAGAIEDAALAPLIEAGFEIVSVLSPAQALGRVIRARQVGAPAGTAVAALSLNSHGAAIAIVSGTDVIHSRMVEWPLGTPFVDQRGDKRGARSELLDRYLLVSQIAPQLQHDIELVRPVHGVTVTSVVACGNLPNLRSLAMLLIEEMDMEVETLDSAELLDPGVAPGLLVDAVASLQLAAAVASSGENRVPVHAESASTPDTNDASVEHSSKRVWPGARLQSLAAVAVLAFCTAWSMIQVAGSSPARPIFPNGIDHVLVAAGPAPAPAGPAPGVPEIRTEATTGRVDAVAAAAAPSVPGPERRDVLPEAENVRSGGRRMPGHVSQVALPLPSVDGIVISGAYRLAIVGGNVVAAGDHVGTRAIARIERDGVVLREPSGQEVYVAIRPRKPPALGS